MKTVDRFKPFLTLLEARYLPLLFIVARQAYVVYLWLLASSDRSVVSQCFSVLGALGYEFVYVGAIAWAEEKRFTKWTWLAAIAALIFSSAVAYHVYQESGVWAWLHVGYPLVGFFYTMNMFTLTRPTPVDETTTEDLKTLILELRNDNHSYTEIANELNMSRSAVYRIAQSENGFEKTFQK